MAETASIGNLGSPSLTRRAIYVVALVLASALVSCSSQGASCGGDSSGLMGSDSSHIVILLDDSQSMENLVHEVVSSFNNLLSKLPQNATLSLYGFGNANGVKVIIDREIVSSVKPLKISDYEPTGQTPLYDAINFSLNRNMSISGNQSEKFTFFIISDGGENASVSFELAQTRSRIQKATDSGITIRFVALGEDATLEATNLGLDTSDTESFRPDSGGVNDAFENIGGSLNQQTGNEVCNRFMP
ncbi:MAG: hypothetical protein RL430_762 [Actinomycetota bacterium]